MTELLRRETAHYNELRELLKDTKNPDHLFGGMTQAKHEAVPSHVTLLIGGGKIGLYNAKAKQARVWNEPDLG